MSKVYQPAHHWKDNFIVYIIHWKVVPCLNLFKSYCFSKTCQYFLIFLKVSFNLRCKYLTNHKSKVYQTAHHWKENFILYINNCKVVPCLNLFKSYCFSKTCQYFLIFLKVSFNLRCKYLTNHKSKVYQPAHHWKQNFMLYKKVQ